jgi:hypothetical protein
VGRTGTRPPPSPDHGGGCLAFPVAQVSERMSVVGMRTKNCTAPVGYAPSQLNVPAGLRFSNHCPVAILGGLPGLFARKTGCWFLGNQSESLTLDLDLTFVLITIPLSSLPSLHSILSLLINCTHPSSLARTTAVYTHLAVNIEEI